MKWRLISTLIYKDITLFLRNRMLAPITIFMLVVYTAMYFIMPKSVNEMIKVGLYAPAIPPFFAEMMDKEGQIIKIMESEKALKDAVAEGQYPVGFVLPGNLMEEVKAGEKARINIFFSNDFPRELQDGFITLLQELTFQMGGQPLSVEVSEKILGRDMAGMQIPLRNKMIPFFALFILMIETMGLAGLITEESEQRTLQALLITPLRIEGLMLSKCITGMGLAFLQVMLLMAVTGALRHQPILVMGTLLLGSLLVTGIGFMLASVAKDMMSAAAWGILVILILAIPSFGIMLPGMISEWVKIIPSFYLIDTIHQVINFKVGWSEVWQSLVILFAFGTIFLWIGTRVLKRKFR